MQNRKILVAFMVLILLLMVGCGSDPVKSDLEEYLNFEMSVQKEAENFSLDLMSNMSNTAKDKAEVVKMFSDANGKLTEFAEKQKGYKPKTKEVQAIHDKYLKMLDNSTYVFNEITNMLNADKPTKEQLETLTQKQQEIIKLTKEYRDDIRNLAEQKKVEVKLFK
ncbi:MAG: hypothetical protein H6Q73_310 [Firmicutes bacterium]|nr:hypothetical protein [Bacillota bacterium]